LILEDAATGTGSPDRIFYEIWGREFARWLTTLHNYSNLKSKWDEQGFPLKFEKYNVPRLIQTYCQAGFSQTYNLSYGAHEQDPYPSLGGYFSEPSLANECLLLF
jgi:hypothetical protein